MCLFLSALMTTLKSVAANGVRATWKHIRAQIRDLLLDVEIRALHDRHDCDQRRDAHRQPHDSEDGSELMRPQRGHALRYVVAVQQHTITRLSRVYTSSQPG